MTNDIQFYSNDDRCLNYVKRVGTNPLVVFCSHPRVNIVTKNDGTISKVKKFAEILGHDGFYIFYLCPLLVKDSSQLPASLDQSILNDNLNLVASIIEDGATLWAAWGKTITERKYLAYSLVELFKLLESRNVNWIQCGKMNDSSHPRSPSLPSYQSPFSIFNVKEYINENKL